MQQFHVFIDILISLLQKHDFAGLPNFGAFVTRTNSVQYKPGTNLLIPPSKHIMFNKNIIHQDGLLVNALMQSQNITFKEAEAQINLFVEYLQSVLTFKKQIELKGLGLFYIEKEKDIRFEPFAEGIPLAHSFGLEQIQAIKLVNKQIENNKPKNFMDRTTIPLQTNRSNKKATKIAIATVSTALILLFCAIFLGKNNTQSTFTSSFSLFNSTTPVYVPSDSKIEIQLLSEVQVPNFKTLNKNSSVKLFNSSKIITVIPFAFTKTDKSVFRSLMNSRAKYQVIIGSYKKQYNIIKSINRVAKMQLKAYVYKKSNGLATLSIAGFDTDYLAKQFAANIQDICPQSWVDNAVN